MNERGIIFSTDMVKAILDGRKTQTRRVIKDPRRKSPCNPRSTGSMGGVYSIADIGRELELAKDTKPNFPCPYGQVGDRLWVRETWGQAINIAEGDTGTLYYKATNETGWKGQWKSPRFMFRWMSRINLEITELRVERLQDIIPNDARREGIKGLPNLKMFSAVTYANLLDDYYEDYDGEMVRYVAPFIRLWDSINAKRGYSFESNPWVWVIGFRRLND